MTLIWRFWIKNVYFWMQCDLVNSQWEKPLPALWKKNLYFWIQCDLVYSQWEKPLLAGNQVSQSSAWTIFLLHRSLTYTCLASTAAYALDISAPSLIDLHALSRVANTAACALHICSKWLVQKKLQKIWLWGKSRGVERGLLRCSRCHGRQKAGHTRNGCHGRNNASQQIPAIRRR